MDKGYGAAGVAMCSAPTEGVKAIPLSQVKATFPILGHPGTRHKAVGLDLEHWTDAFTNTFSAEESQRLYERYHVPASGPIFWQRPRQHPPRPRRHVGRRQEPGPGAAAAHLG